MLSRNHNLIQQEEIGDHIVNKYEFKPIHPMELQPIKQEISVLPESSTLESNDTPLNEVAPTQKNGLSNSLEKELIEKLLHKSDELSGNLARLEMQFEKSQANMQESIEQAKDESYKRGFEDGKNEANKPWKI